MNVEDDGTVSSMVSVASVASDDRIVSLTASVALGVVHSMVETGRMLIPFLDVDSDDVEMSTVVSANSVGLKYSVVRCVPAVDWVSVSVFRNTEIGLPVLSVVAVDFNWQK